MRLFKVEIREMRPVSSQAVSYSELEKGKDELVNEQGVVTALFIVAEDEADSMKIAGNLIDGLRDAMGMARSESEPNTAAKAGSKRDLEKR